MKREKLELYLGKEVNITLGFGETETGILVKGDGYEKNYYSCSFNETGGRCWFRSSHVTKIKESGTYNKIINL